MATDTVNQFVDWGSEFHDPPWQVNNGLPILQGTTTVYDALVSPSVVPQLNVQSQGSGAGLYVTAIDGVVQNQDGNGYYWVYFVNGQTPNVGAGAYVVKNGDSIAWDYKHFSSGLRQATQPPI